MKYLFGLSEINVDKFITPWTFQHFLSGIYITYVLKYMKYSDVFSFIVYNLIHFIYELKDYIFTYYYNIKRNNSKGNLNLLYNSYLNTIGDLLFGMIGSILILYMIQVNKNILNIKILKTLTIMWGLITCLFCFCLYLYMVG